MRVGGDLMGECQHLFTEDEVDPLRKPTRNSKLPPGATTLCGEEYPHGVGTYRVSAWASLRGLDGMEEYLERKASTLCPECLALAVRFHGWPEPPEEAVA